MFANKQMSTALDKHNVCVAIFFLNSHLFLSAQPHLKGARL